MAQDARRPGDWATDQSRVPVLPRLGRAVASQDEVLSPQGDEGSSARLPELIANTPSTLHGVPRPNFDSSDHEAVNLERPRPAVPAWHEPVALLERLDALASKPGAGAWAKETAESVRSLGAAVSEGSDEAISILGRLEQSAAGAAPLASSLSGHAAASDLRRAGYALSRRLFVWRQIVRSLARETPPDDLPPIDPQRLAFCLAELDAITGHTVEGEAWREYLLVDALREWSNRPANPGRFPPPEDRLPRALAEQALQRLTRVPMTASQRRFVSSGPMAALRTELQRCTAEPVDLARLSLHLERYEQSGLASDARLVAGDFLDLGFSPEQERRRLADQLRPHYCNANLRVAVTGELLNRLMPEREPEYAQVRERVMGVPVFGRSTTSTEVAVQLIPDPNRVRMALEVSGRVASLTSSTSWPATFVNNGRATYTARKPLELDLHGIHFGQAEVQVYNRMSLRDVRTEFDGVPLVAPLVRSIASSQHERSRPAANREVRGKIAAKARQRVDSEADVRLAEVSQLLAGRAIDPMQRLSLQPTMISAETTGRRMTMRVRLAGKDQLGGHTPRPRAPSDCLASFQVHESAINNVLQRLELEDRTFTLPELARHVTSRLNRPKPWDTDPQHDDVEITFAPRDAVSVRLRGGRVELTLAVAKLRKPPRQWDDFRVRVVLRPVVHERLALLIREGVVHLQGQEMGNSSRIALSGIFSQLFSKQRPTYLTPERLENDPAMAGLQFTQFVIEDGWLGVAIGARPKQSVPRTVLRP